MDFHVGMTINFRNGENLHIAKYDATDNANEGGSYTLKRRKCAKDGAMFSYNDLKNLAANGKIKRCDFARK